MSTLLLADESATIQRVIELTFANEDVRVIAVGDGESAVARFDEDRPDIVLADVGLTGVDGYQMAAHVKGSPGKVPVLLLTGAFEPVDEDRARATGCDGVLVKPFEPRQLIRTVRELLSGAQPAGLWPADMPRVDTSATFGTPLAEPVPMVAEVHPEPVPVPMVAEVHPEPAPAPVEELPKEELPKEEPIDVPVQAEAVALVEELPQEEPIDVAVPAVETIPVIERVELPVSAAVVPFVSDLDDLPVPPQGEFSAHVEVPAAPPVVIDAKRAPSTPMSLGNVFSAMLAAEQQNPDALKSMAASPALSEAAVEEIVQKVLRKMTNEHVRKIVLETAERLIREEIARIKL